MPAWSATEPTKSTVRLPATVAACSSEAEGSGAAANLLDGNPATLWHTHSVARGESGLPQWVVLDLGASKKLTGFTYLPRQDGTVHGMVDKYALHVSPDGKSFAFVSTRAGGANVFVANVDGSPRACADGASAKACQLTTDGGYEDAVWAPVGNQIAFARRTGNRAAIGVVASDGSGQRALTTAADNTLDIKPSWSPDARRLAFSRIIGNSGQLHVVALKTGEARRLDVPGNAFEPGWGPKLP